MKQIVLVVCMLIFLFGCSNEEIEEITKDYFIQHAKIGLSLEEVLKLFGKPNLEGIDGFVDVWMYEKTKPEFSYERNMNIVNHQEIIKGNIYWKIYVLFAQDKAFMYQYFYLGENGEVWQHSIEPDNVIKDQQVSNTYK